MPEDKIQHFLENVALSIEKREIVKVVLSKKQDKSSDLKLLILTLVKLKAGYRLSFVYRHNTKDITKNFPIADGLDLLKKAINEDFYNAKLFSNAEDTILNTYPNGKNRLLVNRPSLPPLTTYSHDKQKKRRISTVGNVYLKSLGVTNAKAKVRHEMMAKFRQINRYIELLSPYLKQANFKSGFHIADMGSGKGYLTFALYDFLIHSLKFDVKITGVEFRDNLVASSNAIAQKANFENLSFIQGTIETAKLDSIDVLIALHACDTATDDAIFRGITAKAQLIVCAPCCHKQIRKEFNVTSALSAIVAHGILKERQAEIITDTLRALIMEAYGYKTKIFEFISTEHTPKNLMLVGQKVGISDTKKATIMAQISSIKKQFGITTHYLEMLLGIS